MIGIPEAFARSTVEREGERGAAWLAELPGIVEELLERWGCVPDGAVMHGVSGSSSRCDGGLRGPPC